MFAQSSSEDGTYPRHSCILIGWKEMPDGQKVWIMRNSYGSRFGMNGDLYV